MHVSCAGSALYEPALQLVALSLPTGQKVPSGHTRQSSRFVMRTWVDGAVVPPGQGKAAEARSPQKSVSVTRQRRSMRGELVSKRRTWQG